MAGNPFATVGITPAVAKKLNDKQMETFLKHLKRGWNAVSHPDLGGNQKTFQTMSEAFDELEDPAARRRHRNNYTKQRGAQKQVTDLEKTVKELQRHLGAFSSRYLSFIQAAHGQTGEETVFHYPNGVPVSDPEPRLKEGSVSHFLVIHAAKSSGITYTRFKRKGGSRYPFRRVDQDPVYEPDRFLFGVLTEKHAQALGGLEQYRDLFTSPRKQVGGRVSQTPSGSRLVFTRNQLLPLMPYIGPEIAHGRLLSTNRDGTMFYFEGTIPIERHKLKFE